MRHDRPTSAKNGPRSAVDAERVSQEGPGEFVALAARVTDEAARLAADRLDYPGTRSGRDVVYDYAERVGHLRFDRKDDDE